MRTYTNYSKMEFYKYQGAGNDFLIADNRKGEYSLSTADIAALCERRYGVGADGLMLLEDAEGWDFRMVYYNSDGSGGMMCGNGGRCIVAFAEQLGIRPANGSRYEFIAADGPHSAEISQTYSGAKSVRLRMKDVFEITQTLGGYFLDTGTRHFVKFVDNLEDYNVFGEGRALRYNPEFAPIGTNVNFAEPEQGILHVRTYEKGVEAETFACGTGIVATAYAALYHYSLDKESRRNFKDIICFYRDGRVHVDLQAVRDSLSVDFLRAEGGIKDVWLTGPAAYVCKVLV